MMVYGKQIVTAHMNGWNMGAISLSLYVQNGDLAYAARPVVFEQIDPQTYSTEPTVNLQREAAQQLMDELWRVGLRPSEGSGSAGALAATERHLADMRAIAMLKVGVK